MEGDFSHAPAQPREYGPRERLLSSLGGYGGFDIEEQMQQRKQDAQTRISRFFTATCECQGQSLNVRDAAKNERSECLLQFIDQAGELDADEHGQTALMICAQQCWSDGVKALRDLEIGLEDAYRRKAFDCCWSAMGCSSDSKKECIQLRLCELSKDELDETGKMLLGIQTKKVAKRDQRRTYKYSGAFLACYINQQELPRIPFNPLETNIIGATVLSHLVVADADVSLGSLALPPENAARFERISALGLALDLERGKWVEFLAAQKREIRGLSDKQLQKLQEMYRQFSSKRISLRPYLKAEAEQIFKRVLADPCRCEGEIEHPDGFVCRFCGKVLADKLQKCNKESIYRTVSFATPSQPASCLLTLQCPVYKQCLPKFTII